MLGIDVATMSLINGALDDGFGGIVKRERSGFATADSLTSHHRAIPNCDRPVRELDLSSPRDESRG